MSRGRTSFIAGNWKMYKTIEEAERYARALLPKVASADGVEIGICVPFPALAPMVRFHELSTPLTQRRYVRSPDGAMYGIEMSADRLTTPALRVRTPVRGLLLAGQDVTSPGVAGAFMGGLMAAAALEPALLRQLAG